MIRLLKDIAKKAICIIPLDWLSKVMSWKMGYPVTSFAPDGEDLILQNMFLRKEHGFYVDVGAHHPIRFSNTYLLYKKGWNGINIDAMPGSMEIFNKLRPRDINIEAAISEKFQTLTYHSFKEPAYNTLSKETAEKVEQNGIKKVGTFEISTKRLGDILSENLPAGTQINILSIDVEGFDLDVLRSNDWTKFKPSVIAVEEIGFDAENPNRSNIFNYLKQQGYHLEIASPKTVFYRRTV